MPSKQIVALAKRAGKEAEAEAIWKKAKEQSKGAKLKDGSTIPKSEGAWEDKHFAYITGVFKKMLGIKEATGNDLLHKLSREQLKRRRQRVFQALKRVSLSSHARLDEDGLNLTVPLWEFFDAIAEAADLEVETIDKQQSFLKVEFIPLDESTSQRTDKSNALLNFRRLKESGDIRRFRVVVDGDTVQMVHEGTVVHEGEDATVDQTRAKVQALLNRDHPAAFDLNGTEGTLAELETKVFADWFLFCMEGSIATPTGVIGGRDSG